MTTPAPSLLRAEDARLLASIAHGDTSAFDALWREHHPRVFRLAYGVLLDRDDARDVAQEVFMALLKVAPRWRPDARVTTWLHRTTTTMALGRRRRVLRFRRPWSRDRTPPPPPDRSLAARRADDALRRALTELSPRARAVLTLHWELDLGPAEIADVLGLQPGAARVALHRARVAVRAVLEPLEADR